MPLYPLIYVLINFIVIFIDIITLAMAIRAIISWFFDLDGKFIRFLYVLTEPAIMPIRKLFYKMNWFQDSPLDIAHMTTYLVLAIIRLLLSIMVA